MRLSKRSDYALRAMLALALAVEGKPLQIGELGEREGIPVKFLEQILLTLKRGGLLRSKRGVGGGYLLARPAGEITLGEVIRIVEGPLAVVPEDGDVPRAGALQGWMEELSAAIARRLDATSLEALRLKALGEGGELHFEI
jgi:Rrf2 family protein